MNLTFFPNNSSIISVLQTAASNKSFIIYFSFMTVFEKRLKHVDIDLDYNRGLGKKDYVFQLLSIKCHNA